jgi:hypothetical protein
MSHAGKGLGKVSSGVFTFVFFVALLPATSFGHARLRLGGTLPPRSTSAGLKSGPCGNVARTNNPTLLQAGQQLTVQWDEVIDHPGYYRVAFSPANDQGFDANVLVLKVNDLPGVHAYEATITVPNVECTQCTIQLIQYMTENNPPSLYYSCADVEIRKGVVVPSPVPSPVPSGPPPAPVPIPTNCH